MAKLNLKLPKKRTIQAPAPLFKRFGAYAADFIIVNIILMPLSNSIVPLLPSERGFMNIYEFVQSNPQITSALIAHAILSGIIMLLYFTYFEYKMQQTPGKLLFRTSIVPDGKVKLTFWNYLLSNISFIPSLPFFILLIVDAVYIVISPKNQRLMEKIAKILVVEEYNI